MEGYVCVEDKIAGVILNASSLKFPRTNIWVQDSV
jgi:hypothetical protein